VCAALVSVAAALSAKAGESVTAAAVWHPPAEFLSGFHASCDGLGGQAFDACFVARMAKAGASPPALAFAKSLDSEAYLEAFAPTGGPVAIAHVFYPFRANENSAWLIVDGMPPLIDVDDFHHLNLIAMRSAPGYRAIARRYPQLDLWPGDRGAAGPAVEAGGRRVLVDYLLRDLCHACAVVGRVRFAFVFDKAGKFIGTRLVSVTAANRSEAP
jgi:hypothetical protein